MDINIFTKYKVKYTNKYSYRNEEGDFSDGHAEWTKVLDGYTFMSMIFKHVEDYEFMRILIENNMIYIENFDPNSGEASDFKYIFEETNEDE